MLADNLGEDGYIKVPRVCPVKYKSIFHRACPVGFHLMNNYMLKKFLLFTFCLLLTTFLGCGYTFHSNLPSYMKNIYVENFKNRIEFTKNERDSSSYFPGLENDIVEAVENRFVLEGSLQLSDDKEMSDIVLTGNLVNYIKQPLRYDGDNVEEYRLSIVIDCKVEDLEKNEIVWEDKVIGDTTYFLTGALAKTETEAVGEAVDDLARRVVEKTVVQW